MSKFLYPIYKLNIESYKKWWLYHKKAGGSGILSEILQGFSFNLENTLNRKFNLFEIEGNSEQDNIAYIDTGSWEQGSIDGTNGSNISDNTYVRTVGFIPVFPNVLYNISRSIYSSYNIYRFYDSNKNYIGTHATEGMVTTNQDSNRMVDGVSSMTMTIINTNVAYMRIADNSNNLSTVYTISTTAPNPSYPQEIHSTGDSGSVNETISNSDNTESQNISFPLAQGQKLMEDGTIADGKVINEWGEYVFTGNETFTRDKELTNSYRFYTPSNTIPNSISGTSISTHFKNSTVNSISNIDEQALTVINDNQIVLRINKDIASTVQELKDLLAQWYTNGNPLKVQFHRVTPIEEDFTEEQQAVWEQIKALRTYKPVTHISSTDETPAYLKIQYYKEG